MRILALDLGKSKSAACLWETDSGEAKYGTVRTEMSSMAAALERWRPDRLVMEVGPIAGWVCDLAARKAIPVQVANPSTEGWRWRNVKRKTDRLDALKLARLSAVEQMPQVHMPSPVVRQWRSLIGYRQRWVQRVTAIKNSIRDILLRQGLGMAKGKSGWTDQNLQEVRSLAVPLEQTTQEDLWRGQLDVELEALAQAQARLKQVQTKLDQMGQLNAKVQLLQTIPGVGPRLSEAIVAILDDPHRFANGRQVGSYAGLVPRQRQSGNTDRHGRITKAGSSLLRVLLVEVGWVGVRWNPWMREIYRRTHRGIKSRRKVAIVAVARHLLVWCWAMLRDNKSWQPPDGIPPIEPQQPKPVSRKPRFREFYGLPAQTESSVA
jgi:transposase